MNALDKLKRIPNNDIQKKLKVSFDDLDDILKEIILDISCLFIGKDRSDITHILDGSELFADIGMCLLVERSLVSCAVDDTNKLGMHDLVRDMGWEIIRQQEPKKLGKHSRLWSHQKVHDVLSKHSVRTLVSCIYRSLYKNNIMGSQVNLNELGKWVYL